MDRFSRDLSWRASQFIWDMGSPLSMVSVYPEDDYLTSLTMQQAYPICYYQSPSIYILLFRIRDLVLLRHLDDSSLCLGILFPPRNQG